jgi:hypothetical protein
MVLTYLPFQIILLVFLLFAFSRVLLRFKEATISVGAFLFWTSIWVLATLSVLEPEFTTWVANKLGVGRGSDAIIYISLILLYYLVYRTNIHLENVREEITKLSRIIALKEQKSSIISTGGRDQNRKTNKSKKV